MMSIEPNRLPAKIPFCSFCNPQAKQVKLMLKSAISSLKNLTKTSRVKISQGPGSREKCQGSLGLQRLIKILYERYQFELKMSQSCCHYSLQKYFLLYSSGFVTTSIVNYKTFNSFQSNYVTRQRDGTMNWNLLLPRLKILENQLQNCNKFQTPFLKRGRPLQALNRFDRYSSSKQRKQNCRRNPNKYSKQTQIQEPILAHKLELILMPIISKLPSNTICFVLDQCFTPQVINDSQYTLFFSYQFVERQKVNGKLIFQCLILQLKKCHKHYK